MGSIMAQATLTNPLTLNPQQATRLVIREARVDFDAREVLLRIDYVSAQNVVLETRTVVVDGAQVQTWINNQENTLYTRLLAKLGVTGNIA